MRIAPIALAEFGRSPEKGVSTSGNNNSADGRDHWPYCYTAVVGGAGIKRGYVHGKSDATGSAPVENPVHPAELLATIYHAVGIDPETIVKDKMSVPLYTGFRIHSFSRERNCQRRGGMRFRALSAQIRYLRGIGAGRKFAAWTEHI